MEIFVLTFVVIGLAVVGMATGLLVRRSGLKGTCATLGEGSLAGLACDICPSRHWHDAPHPKRCPRQDLLANGDGENLS